MNQAEDWTGGRRSFVSRVVSAALLDVSVYNEVEHDQSATGQAAGLVAIVAVASAVGGIGSPGSGIIGGIIAAVLGWLIWAGVTYVVGDKILGGTASWGELLRTLGFAQAPGIFYVAAGLPFFGWLVRGLVVVWILFAGIVAIREALDFSTGKAVLTALIGWFFLALLTLFFTIPAALGN